VGEVVTADRRKGSDHQQKGHNDHRHKGRDRGTSPEMDASKGELTA
jgi:hypothetical protein